MSYIVVAYHTTDARYQAHADRLRKSLDDHGIPHNIRSIDSFTKYGSGPGAWLQGTNYKSRFISEMMAWYHDRDIVYVDADSAFLRPPTLFDAYPHDIGLFQRPGRELHAATIFLRTRSAGAQMLIGEWLRIQTANPRSVDQAILTKLVKEHAPALDIGQLPHGYCVKFDDTCEGDRVIEQYQASRKVSDRT